MLQLDTETVNAARALVDDGDGGLERQDVWPVDFIELVIPAGLRPDGTARTFEVIRLTNHFHDISTTSSAMGEDGNPIAGNQTFTAVAQLLGFGNIADNLEVKDNNLDVTLSGVGSEAAAIVLANPVEGSRIYVRRGFYIERSGELVAPPYQRWAGRVYSYSIQDDFRFSDGDTIVISIQCKSLLLTILERVTGRYTNTSGYEQFFPNDKSMEFVASLVNFAPDFGKGADSGGGGGGGGGGGKIVCTAMNEQYGFGSYRNKLWLDYSKEHLTKTHAKGYHAIFKPILAKMYKENEKWWEKKLRVVVEGMARRRTNDIWNINRGRKRNIFVKSRSVLPSAYMLSSRSVL